MENFKDFFGSMTGTEDPFSVYTASSALFEESSSSPLFYNESFPLTDTSIIDSDGLIEDSGGGGDVVFNGGEDGGARNQQVHEFPWACNNITEFTTNQFCMENYLELYLGPRSLPLETLVPVTIIYVIIFVTGVFGNVTTCIVILTNQYMQTATNYYLFNLAMADMTTLVVG